MTKKLFVPKHVAKAAESKKILSKPLEAAFRTPQEEDKNEDDPSNMDKSVIDRLPQLCNCVCVCNSLWP